MLGRDIQKHGEPFSTACLNGVDLFLFSSFALCFFCSRHMKCARASFSLPLPLFLFCAHVVLFTFQRFVSLLQDDDDDAINGGVVEHVLPPLHV